MSGPYDQQVLGSGHGYQAAQAPYQRSGSTSSSSSSRGYAVAAGGSYSGGSHHQFTAEACQPYGGAAVAVGGPRRQGRYQKQVIRLPDQPQGPARQVRRRLPTPEPDTIERVYIQRSAPEIVEEITEVPSTPPPRVQERTVVEPAGPPQVIRRVVRVPPRGGNYGGYQQQSAGSASGFSQGGGSLLGAGSYGSVQPAVGNYQQYSASSYGSVGGGYQQGFNFGGYSSQSAGVSAPRAGVSCFYV